MNCTPNKSKLRNDDDEMASPWNKSLLTKSERELYSPPQKPKQWNPRIVRDVTKMETVKLYRVPNDEDTLYTIVNGHIPMRIVNIYEWQDDTYGRLKCHAIDMAGNCMKVTFLKKTDAYYKDFDWAMQNCAKMLPDGNLVATGRVFYFERVGVSKKYVGKEKFSGAFQMELTPKGVYKNIDVHPTKDYEIPYISMNVTEIKNTKNETIFPKNGEGPNIDTFGIIEETKFVQAKDYGISTQDFYNIVLCDEEDNKIVVQALGAVALRLKKFVKDFTRENSIIGLRNIHHTFGIHGDQYEMPNFFFMPDSEPYTMEQLQRSRNTIITSFIETYKQANKLLEDEEYEEINHT